MTAEPAEPTPLPPDPVQYDAVRNEHARKRGLPSSRTSPAATDPDLPETLARERPYVLLLIAMVIAIVLIGFVLGVVDAILAVPPLDVPPI